MVTDHGLLYAVEISEKSRIGGPGLALSLVGFAATSLSCLLWEQGTRCVPIGFGAGKLRCELFQIVSRFDAVQVQSDGPVRDFDCLLKGILDENQKT